MDTEIGLLIARGEEGLVTRRTRWGDEEVQSSDYKIVMGLESMGNIANIT